MLYRFVFIIFAPLIVLPCLKLFNRVEITGLEHLPPEGPVVVVANHISSWDPAILYALIRRRAYFMAKAELFRVPLLGFILRRINAFPVKRDAIDRAALRRAAQILEEGHVLVIFPEGHRSKTGELLPFKQGAALFAHRAKAAVIPVLFETTKRAIPWPIGKRIRATFGGPLDLAVFMEKKADSALLEQMTDAFRQGILQLKGATDRPELPGRIT